MTARRITGFLLAVFGILLGVALSIPGIILTGAYWNAPETGGNAGRAVLIGMIALGFVIGFGLFKLGRRIAK
jgi:hypothetical protein